MFDLFITNSRVKLDVEGVVNLSRYADICYQERWVLSWGLS